MTPKDCYKYKLSYHDLLTNLTADIIASPIINDNCFSSYTQIIKI